MVVVVLPKEMPKNEQLLTLPKKQTWIQDPVLASYVCNNDKKRGVIVSASPLLGSKLSSSPPRRCFFSKKLVAEATRQQAAITISLAL